MEEICSKPLLRNLFQEAAGLVEKNKTIKLKKIFSQMTSDSEKYKLLTFAGAVNGNTLLHLAVSSGHSNTVQCILEVEDTLTPKAGCTEVSHKLINIRNVCGNTPVHETVQSGDQAMLKRLLAGTSASNDELVTALSVVNNLNRNVLHLCYVNKEMEMFDWIIEMLETDDDKIKLMTAGCDDGGSLLQYAAERQDIDFLCRVSSMIGHDTRSQLYPDGQC